MNITTDTLSRMLPIFNSAAHALRYLSTNDRPEGGECAFNAIHLEMIALELETFVKKLLYSETPVLEVGPQSMRIISGEDYKTLMGVKEYGG